MSSANAFNLDQSKILSFGYGLDIIIWKEIVTKGETALYAHFLFSYNNDFKNSLLQISNLLKLVIT